MMVLGQVLQNLTQIWARSIKEEFSGETSMGVGETVKGQKPKQRCDFRLSPSFLSHSVGELQSVNHISEFVLTGGIARPPVIHYSCVCVGVILQVLQGFWNRGANVKPHELLDLRGPPACWMEKE